MTEDQGHTQYSDTGRFTEAAPGDALAETVRSAGHLVYSRHFAALFCMAALLVATAGRRPALGTIASFGVYGAIHAAAVVVGRRAPRRLWSGFMFIAIAAGISMAAVSLCLGASRLMPSGAGKAGLCVLVTTASGIGAAAYVLLIKKYFFRGLSFRAAAGIVLLCCSATLAVMLSPKIPKTIDGLWFALSWWFVFSAGLLYYDVKLDLYSRRSIK